MDKRGGGEGGREGVSRFSVEIVLSHSTETFRRGTLLCCVSENFWHRKILWIRGRGERGSITIFRQNFLSHSAEKFRRGTLLRCVSENIWYQKILWIRGGWGGGREYHDFPSKLFCLTVPKHFVEEPFCAVFQKISGIKKFYG